MSEVSIEGLVERESFRIAVEGVIGGSPKNDRLSREAGNHPAISSDSELLTH